MLNKIKKSNSEGFTIIEVMIVLAVAALILLIVLLAVPALQRNSRNTALKNDVSTVAGGISTYMSDNSGTEPAYVGGKGTVSIGASSSSSADETISVEGNTQVTWIAAPPATISNSTIYVSSGYDCSGNAPATSANTSNDIALYYNIETSSGNTEQCTTAE